jgi:LPS sulfotransferase NodH
MIYPKVPLHLTEGVLRQANERADRWLVRYRAACKERDALALELKELRKLYEV